MLPVITPIFIFGRFTWGSYSSDKYNYRFIVQKILHFSHFPDRSMRSKMKDLIFWSVRIRLMTGWNSRLFISGKIRKDSSVLDRDGDWCPPAVSCHCFLRIRVVSLEMSSVELWRNTTVFSDVYFKHSKHWKLQEDYVMCHLERIRSKTSMRAKTITMSLKCQIWRGSSDGPVWIWRDSVVGAGR